MEGNGIPGCREPIGWIIILMALRSVNILHLPDFFLMTNTREFQGLVDSSICRASSCSWTSAWSFSFVIDHWSTQLGCSVTHLSSKAVGVLTGAPGVKLTCQPPAASCLWTDWTVCNCLWKHCSTFWFFFLIRCLTGFLASLWNWRDINLCFPLLQQISSP